MIDGSGCRDESFCRMGSFETPPHQNVYGVDVVAEATTELCLQERYVFR